MYSEITKDIKVSVTPYFVEAESNPAKGVFAFAYTISIENLGDETVQLIDRHWIVSSGEAPLVEVVGPGVYGEQPLLESGSAVEYTSSAIIEDPAGSMEGSYTFKTETGKYFEVVIPRFELLSSHVTIH